MMAPSKSKQPKIFGLSEILSSMEIRNSYFDTFLSSNSTAIGVIKLKPGENDDQQPHPSDEVYYVIEGSGMINIEGRDYVVRERNFILVPAKRAHRFHENKDTLIVLYIFLNC
jgi:mannose-6-phosphate isomerase-like protein (cupin superfamily)